MGSEMCIRDSVGGWLFDEVPGHKFVDLALQGLVEDVAQYDDD